ncbi:DNA polymerase III subunit chi [Rhodoferax sp.]|uniref:DNA polymerase III subunit chi n=1 Tax=Rhodoferax sp. TaxID=50421 RepID=UPI0025EE32A3|nr:DNA polymerase III subunit chi [Rhodoferax sp.]MCM2296595.1 DNA polymerase III subunit chi [Rhodoferax sp.]MDD3935080.1 DNA polymerase III subunit chi [Rhodoferax sp.]
MPVTKVEFHTQAPDRLLYASRLLRKAAASGAQVGVTADETTLRQFDQLLWTFSGTDFVPHCFQDAPMQVLANSPIVLSQNPQTLARSILLNLGSDVPVDFEQFARIIEIVSEDADDKRQARNRWKRYASSACELSNHVLQATAPR